MSAARPLLHEVIAKLSSDGADPIGPCLSAASNSAWLADRFAIALLPSARVFVHARRVAEGGSERRPFLGIGSPSLGSFKTAHDTEELLATLADALDADPDSDVVVGPSATKELVLSLDRAGELARYRVLCFATHAIVPTTQDLLLEEPGLQLSDVDASAGDSVLWASDAARLHLDADWVLLTACDTASASGRTAHEPLSGLARAFLLAGARALLISHWLVDASATRALMTELFHPRRAGSARAAALRSAMSVLRTHPRIRHFAHPGFWAAFSIIGDGGSRTGAAAGARFG